MCANAYVKRMARLASVGLYVRGIRLNTFADVPVPKTALRRLFSAPNGQWKKCLNKNKKKDHQADGELVQLVQWLVGEATKQTRQNVIGNFCAIVGLSACFMSK